MGEKKKKWTFIIDKSIKQQRLLLYMILIIVQIVLFWTSDTRVYIIDNWLYFIATILMLDLITCVLLKRFFKYNKLSIFFLFVVFIPYYFPIVNRASSLKIGGALSNKRIRILERNSFVNHGVVYRYKAVVLSTQTSIHFDSRVVYDEGCIFDATLKDGCFGVRYFSEIVPICKN